MLRPQDRTLHSRVCGDHLPEFAAIICWILQHVDLDAMQPVLMIKSAQWGIDVAVANSPFQSARSSDPIFPLVGNKTRTAQRNPRQERVYLVRGRPESASNLNTS